MKIALRYILLLSILALLVQCNNDEVTSRVFPRLKTLPVTEITEEGVRFNAEFIFRGDFEIQRYGFAWGERSDPGIHGDSLAVRTDNIQTNTFSEVIDSDLKVGETYHVRAFVETADFIVYGANEQFVHNE